MQAARPEQKVFNTYLEQNLLIVKHRDYNLENRTKVNMIDTNANSHKQKTEQNTGAAPQKLMLAFTPVLIIASGILAFILSGWNASRIAPLRQWAAERDGKELYTEIIHEGPMSPGQLLQQPEELAELIASFPQVTAAFMMQGSEIVASYSRLPGFELQAAQLPNETGATVLNERFLLYRRFFGPGATGENGRRRSHDGNGGGSGKGPRWMRSDSEPNDQTAASIAGQMPRMSIIFVFQNSDRQLIMPLVYQTWLWPAVWLALTLLWALVLLSQRRAASLLAQIQKESHLATIGQMSARLAHEIRNPLGAIRGMAQILQKKLNDENQLDMARTIEQETFRLDNLTGGILDFSRPPVINPARIDLSSIVSDTLKLFQQQNPEVKLNFMAPEKPVLGVGDENAIRQIFLNLLKNAADAADAEKLPIKVEIALSEQNVSIRVINVGEPMSEKRLEEIFEPFVSSKAHGYGLGLPISRKLANSMGGSLRLFNGEDHSIVAEFRLPQVNKA